ncbi:hypothetical protein Tco_0407094 [Tanacetum coccineum]
MVLIRAAAASTYIQAPRSGTLPSGTPPSGTPPLLPIPLPTSSPPLLLPSTDCRADVPEVTLLPRKRLYIALSPIYEIGETLSNSTARPTGEFRAYYDFVGTLDAKIRRDLDTEIDRRSHARTARLMEDEARAAHEAWAQSMDASDMAHSEVRAPQTTVLAQQTEIEDLQAANRRR